MKDIVNAKVKFRERLARVVISVVSICATVMLLEIAIRIIKPQDIGFWDSHSIRRLQNTPPHFVENIPHGRANLFGVQVTVLRAMRIWHCRRRIMPHPRVGHSKC